jgi:hypothetical protein
MKFLPMHSSPVARGWRGLHSDELHNVYALPDIIKVIKSRMRWAWHLACMGEMRNASKFWSGSLKGIDHSEDLGVDWRIILERISGIYEGVSKSFRTGRME